jgi:hypothetical protein
MVERDVAADGRSGRLFGKGGVAVNLGEFRQLQLRVSFPDKVRKPCSAISLM